MLCRNELILIHTKLYYYLCRQLGLPWTGAMGFIGSSMPSAVSTAQGGPGTQGAVPFVAQFMTCTGYEASITDCQSPASTVSMSSCSGWDAGAGGRPWSCFHSGGYIDRYFTYLCPLLGHWVFSSELYNYSHIKPIAWTDAHTRLVHLFSHSCAGVRCGPASPPPPPFSGASYPPSGRS